MKPLLALIMAAFLALTASTLPVQAQRRATVIKRFECVIIPEDSGIPVVLFTDDKAHEVDTPSGTSVLKCQFDIPKGFETASTLHHEDFLCATFLGLTTNTRSVTTKGGKVLLTCQVKPN
jgi:hypothetical protein